LYYAAEKASTTRVRCAWGKLNELSPILTNRGVSSRLNEKSARPVTCVQIVLVYSSETWAMKVNYMRRLERAENIMLRWMFGVKQKQQVDKKCEDK